MMRGSSTICLLPKILSRVTNMVSQTESIRGFATGVWPQRVLRVVLGMLFFYAGYVKLSHVDVVAENLLLLEIFPWSVINIFAVWMLCFEMLLGVFLIAGVWLRACSGTLAGFSLMCLGLISFAIASDLKMHCGCFVWEATGPARNWVSLWHEGIMLASCLWLWATTKSAVGETRGSELSEPDAIPQESLQASR